MILEEQKIIIPKIKIPPVLKGKIKIFSNCKLSKDEVLWFQVSLQLVANHIVKDQIDLSDYYSLNLFFTENGSISFHDELDNVNGMQIYMAIYKMNQIRRKKMAAFSMFVYIEELAHYFWRISDETIIKHKVVEIMQDLAPDFSIDIPKGWGLNGLS